MRKNPFHKAGFNLIELAIVLAIVGAVMGGIYVAASSIYEKRRQAELYSQVMTTAKNVREGWSTKKGFNQQLYAYWAERYQVYPPSVYQSDATGQTEYYHTYGGVIRVMRTDTVASLGPASDQEFLIMLSGIQKEKCVALLSNFGSAEAISAAGITRLGGSWSGPIPNFSQGITPQLAVAKCPKEKWDTLVIGFSLRQ